MERPGRSLLVGLFSCGIELKLCPEVRETEKVRWQELLPEGMKEMRDRED
jgi:hypothetical protein